MSTPSKPVQIASPRQRLIDDLDEAGGAGTPQRRGQYGTPPVGTTIPRFRGTPGASTPMNPGSPPRPISGIDVLRNTPRTGTPFEQRQLVQEGTRTPQQPPENLPDEDKLKVVQRHLVQREARTPEEASSSVDPSRAPSIKLKPSASSSKESSRRPSIHNREDSNPFPLPHNRPGGDVTHEIYKWHERAERNARPRTTSLIAPREVDPEFANIHEPGGFRRNYIIQHGNDTGTEEGPVHTESFIDFLYIFGHFAGEDLEEEEDEAEDEENWLPPGPSHSGPTQSILRRTDTQGTVTRHTTYAAQRPLSPRKLLDSDIDETTPLIRDESLTRRKRSLSRTRRSTRSSAGPHHGDATVTQAVLMLMKAFIGTGILFLGKAFYNGGMLFSAVTLVAIALISLHSFLLLVETKMVVPGSFGDIGGALYGKKMRMAILTSVAVSQLGFVAAYTIFVAENLQAFVMAVTKCGTLLPIQTFIFSQLVVFLPLAMIRDLAKLSITALIADVFILVGIVYIGGNEIAVIAERGVADIKWFNPNDFPLLIGTAVFSFEGIGLVIPITDSMREPKKFPAVLTGVMFFLIFLFGGAGVLSYAAYGPNIETVVIKNLPQDKKFVQVVQFLYSCAILLSAPLQLFPALRIMENYLFTKSGKVDLRVKWTKNFFRMVVVLVTYFVSWAGARDLDKFVSFVGSFACVPLCFVYPAMLHLTAVAKTRWRIFTDWLMIIFGSLAAIYTTIQTIKLMAEPSGETGPTFPGCT